MNIDDQTKHLMHCALADLLGAWQAWKNFDINSHCWEAHEQTIIDLAEALSERLPDNFTGETK